MRSGLSRPTSTTTVLAGPASQKENQMRSTTARYPALAAVIALALGLAACADDPVAPDPIANEPRQPSRRPLPSPSSR